MKQIIFGVTLASVSVLGHASASEVFHKPLLSNTKDALETFYKVGPPMTRYFKTEQLPAAVVEHMDALFKEATKYSSSALPEWEGLSDSFIIEIAPDHLRYVRIDYGVDSLAPTGGRVWIASLRRQVIERPVWQFPVKSMEVPSLFVISEYASVPISEDLIHQLEAVRQSETMVTKRRQQMVESLKNSEKTIQMRREGLALLLHIATTIRQHGSCCPDAEPGSPEAEAIAAEHERNAGKLSLEIQNAAHELEKRREAILPQLTDGAVKSIDEQAAPSFGDKSSK